MRVVSKQTTDDNWWLGELNGQKGLFPHCFVRREICQVLHNYQAQDSDELSLKRGQVGGTMSTVGKKITLFLL